MTIEYEARRKKCKCGRKIIWAIRKAGGMIPLDASAPVYHLNEYGVAVRDKAAFVSHFSTCRYAGEFSKKGKS